MARGALNPVKNDPTNQGGPFMFPKGKKKKNKTKHVNTKK